MRARGARLLVFAVAVTLGAVTVTVVVGGVAAGRLGGRAAFVATPGSVIVVTPATVAVGDQVRVQLSGWPTGVVTASVCGNNAQRGSTDCDQIGGGAVRVPRNGTETLVIDVLAPPVGCPCVVRATTTLGGLVRTAPITILGVPTGVDLAPARGVVDPSSTRVTSRLRNAAVPWPQSWSAAFAGPAHKELVLTVRNRGDVPLDGLRVAGRVGHQGTDEGEPVDAVVPSIPAHSTREVVVPVLLSAPVYGDYVVSGAIYGLATPVRFHEHTQSEPWALEIGLPLLLLLVAQVIRVRDRRRRRAEDARTSAALATAAAATTAAAAAPVEFPQSSPVVGAEDEWSWVSSPYSDLVDDAAISLPDNDPAPAGAGGHV